MWNGETGMKLKKGDEQGACLGTMVHGLGEGEWCTRCRERNAWGKHGY